MMMFIVFDVLLPILAAVLSAVFDVLSEKIKTARSSEKRAAVIERIELSTHIRKAS